MISLAVLGDSDSESYRDTPDRGHNYHAVSLQWTEVLARLRSDELDSGPWGSWGTPGKLAALQRWLGLEVRGRSPRKYDYLYNFAISGAVCGDLMGGDSRQAHQLVSLMDHEPARWRSGVVVIRIGVNSFGKFDNLDKLARDPAAPDVVATMDHCSQQIREAVALIHARHASTRIVLVGIFDNTHWPKYQTRWQSAGEIANISQGLDRFDRVLKGLADSDPRIAFFDDRAWFVRRWGGRDANGMPAYRPVTAGPEVVVTNTIGDEPHNAVLADGHAGVVWNVLWAQSLVELLQRRFGMALRPISDNEIGNFLGSLGIKAARGA